jgi:hypothetical protein
MNENENLKKQFDLKKYILWIIEKKFLIFSVLASIILVNIIIFKIKPLISKKSPKNEACALQSYLDWKETGFKDYKKLDDLKDLIKKYPSLKPNYEGLIIQNLLINESLKKDESKLVSLTLERTKSELPFYYEYSKVALLINDGKLEEALSKSKELKIKMLCDQSFLQGEGLPAGSVLYSLNLLRIALLQGKLGNPSKELLAWMEFEDYLGLTSNKVNDRIQTANKALKEIFSENGIELIDYISFRKNKTSSIKS